MGHLGRGDKDIFSEMLEHIKSVTPQTKYWKK